MEVWILNLTRLDKVRSTVFFMDGVVDSLKFVLISKRDSQISYNSLSAARRQLKNEIVELNRSLSEVKHFSSSYDIRYYVKYSIQ
jgi:cell shape-determining protein MreC